MYNANTHYFSYSITTGITPGVGEAGGEKLQQVLKGTSIHGIRKSYSFCMGALSVRAMPPTLQIYHICTEMLWVVSAGVRQLAACIYVIPPGTLNRDFQRHKNQ